jgi:hypothetical protein
MTFLNIGAIRAFFGRYVIKKLPISDCVLVIGLPFSLLACTNTYDPAQRAVVGGLLGAGAGPAIGAAAGGGHGARSRRRNRWRDRYSRGHRYRTAAAYLLRRLPSPALREVYRAKT